MRAQLFGGIALLAAMAAAAAPARADTPMALATVGMIGDVAGNVAGECVQVETLMGPGIDPHLYEASASDVRLFRQAEAILFAGYSLEGQLGTVLENMQQRKPTVAVSSAAIDTGELITVQDIYGIDPHVWMDVALWSRIAPTIAETLGEIAPSCAGAMRERAQSYQAQLAALDGWIEASIKTIPQGQRVLVTAHDAFAYYGRAYGIDVEAVQGISTESEAGIADINAMVDTVVEHDVPAVFIESTINPRTIQAVVDAAADRGQSVEIGGELYSDAMGAAGTPAGTYIGMMRANTLAIVDALGGEPAPWPAALSEWAQTWQVATSSDE